LLSPLKTKKTKTKKTDLFGQETGPDEEQKAGKSLVLAGTQGKPGFDALFLKQTNTTGNRYMRFAKVVLINIVVMLALWAVVIFSICFIHDIRVGFKSVTSASVDEKRLELPSYPDKQRAAQILHDSEVAGSQYVPFVEWRHAPFKSETVNVDEHGYRVHPGNKTGPIVGLFGGSAMWGWGEEDASTIPGHFDSDTDDYTVNNYAEHAWVSRQSLDELINLVDSGIRPEIVIFYDGYNDVVHLCDARENKTANGHGNVRRMSSLFERNVDSRIWTSLLEPIFGNFISIGGGEPDYQCSSDQERADAVASTLVMNWTIAKMIVDSYGGQFYAFLQPSTFYGSPKADYLPRDLNRLTRDRALFEKEFQAVYPLMLEKLSGKNWFGDLTHVLDCVDLVYVDTVHLNSEGNQIIADAMIDFAIRHRELPASRCESRPM